MNPKLISRTFSGLQRQMVMTAISAPEEAW